MTGDYDERDIYVMKRTESRIINLIKNYEKDFLDACEKLNAKEFYRDFTVGHLRELIKKIKEK